MPGKKLFPQKKIREFCRRNHIRRLSVFGSRIRGSGRPGRPGSDVDVLVEFEEGHVPGLAFFDMERELSGISGMKVDLNTPSFLSRYFRNDVLREAQVQYGE